MVMRIETLFPGLRTSAFRVTSSATRDYNCIAWAAGDVARWWWPDPDSDAVFWPTDVTWEETLDAFALAFATVGYTLCTSEDEVGTGWPRPPVSCERRLLMLDSPMMVPFAVNDTAQQKLT